VPTSDSTVARVAGLTLVGAGIAHLTNPWLFIPLTQQAYSRRVRLHTYVNGAVATAVGLGIRNRRSRSWATLAGVGYGAHLAARTVRSR
jgi:hypothetical protein